MAGNSCIRHLPAIGRHYPSCALPTATQCAIQLYACNRGGRLAVGQRGLVVQRDALGAQHIQHVDHAGLVLPTCRTQRRLALIHRHVQLRGTLLFGGIAVDGIVTSCQACSTVRRNCSAACCC